MSAIELGNVIEGSYGNLRNAGPPVAGTSEVQSLAVTGTPTGGTLSLSFRGQTATVPYNATAAQVQAALTALNTIGGGNLTATGGPLPGSAVVLTFAGTLAKQDVMQIVGSGAALTGGATPAAAVTTTTTGVNTTQPQAGTGQILLDTTNGVTYENKGMPGTPNWTQIGA